PASFLFRVSCFLILGFYRLNSAIKIKVNASFNEEKLKRQQWCAFTGFLHLFIIFKQMFKI
ncbi:MAG: hypothetical protein ACMG51_05475, partial [Ginsengibacter sp.]